MAIKPGWSFGMARGSEREIGPQAGGGLQPYTRVVGGGYGGQLTSQISAQSASARRANITRRKQIEAMYDKMMGMVAPGGAFEKRGLGQIEAAKTKGVGQQMQQMISSGMYGTTTAAGVGKGWEADVGTPARLRLEDIMQQRQLGVMGQKAGFLERIEDVYPDYSSLMQMLAR